MDEQRACPVCGRVVPASRGDSPACSDAHELEHLRVENQRKDERLARLSRKKGPIQCLGQIHWRTCVQEWYLKETYDAKRRAAELRKAGFEVRATTIGQVPADAGNGLELVKMTILTAWNVDEPDLRPPAPASFVDGLRTNNGRRS